MNIGKLDRRIMVQQKTGGGEDESGYPTEIWEDVAELWAAREPLRGHEFFAAAAVQAAYTVRYRIRYRTGITPDMRLVDSGRIYSFVAVLDDVYGDRTQTHIMAEEALQNG